MMHNDLVPEPEPYSVLSHHKKLSAVLPFLQTLPLSSMLRNDLTVRCYHGALPYSSLTVVSRRVPTSHGVV